MEGKPKLNWQLQNILDSFINLHKKITDRVCVTLCVRKVPPDLQNKLVQANFKLQKAELKSPCHCLELNLSGNERRGDESEKHLGMCFTRRAL